MACLIWNGTSEPSDLIKKLFGNENIEAKGNITLIYPSLKRIYNERILRKSFRSKILTYYTHQRASEF